MGEKDLDEPVHEGKAGEEDEDDPSPPEDEEVVLVESVVGEKTENVVAVGASHEIANLIIARDLSGKQVAHRVDWSCSLQYARVLFPGPVGVNIDAVVGIFVVEERVQYGLADQDDNKVENLAEGKSKVVDYGLHGRSFSFQHDLVEPLCRLTVILVHVLNQLRHHAPLENILPEDPRQLGHDGNGGKDEGKPDVILSCTKFVLLLGLVLALELALVLADALCGLGYL